jgi:hypothetical protein
VDRILQFFYDPYAVDQLPDVVSAERSVEGMGTARRRRARRWRAPDSPPRRPAKRPRRRGRGRDRRPPAGIMDPLSLEIRVRIPDNLVLRGSDLRPGGPTGASLGDMNITVGGDVEVLKQPGDPITARGVVNTVRGMYEFQGRRFELERERHRALHGHETEINPLLDISATEPSPTPASRRASASPARPQRPSSSCRARRRSRKATSCRSSSSTAR